MRQVTEVLQRHTAQAKRSDSSLQYPEMLEVLCQCAVLLRQQVQRKLAGPWVNLTEVSQCCNPVLQGLDEEKKAVAE